MRNLTTIAAFSAGLLGAAAYVAIPSGDGFKLAPPPARPVGEAVVTKLETRSVIGNTVVKEPPPSNHDDQPEHTSEAVQARSPTPNSSPPVAAVPPPARRAPSQPIETVREPLPAEPPQAPPILFGNPSEIVMPGLIPPALSRRIERGERGQPHTAADRSGVAGPGRSAAAESRASGQR